MQEGFIFALQAISTNSVSVGYHPDKALIKAFSGRREELKEGNLGTF
jgi:hypothetical protein